ncbi:hypothetical protein KSF_084620 [Reticulibacter mediterranei]|uniref:Bacteriophage Mu GpT domain-containing protein n=1 Tax=Reticulibacter mediterranei TaxID=2778369 RepID=A0A8J3IMN8_9CHLR|nr:Mu-like prophage major head subunit gpT family protein [Reticulibacter mediterranei]GHO98414.1 hypothetical protein KSF_084620 [Reticulibacter mediterranei]
MTTPPAVIREHFILEPQITEQLGDVEAGHEVRVTIIQGGTSKNGYTYDESALRTIAQMVEGAHAYADHALQMDGGVRSIRDVVGFYHDAQFIAASGEQAQQVDATLHIFEAADWLWSLIRESCQLNRPQLIGLSIDVLGQWQLNEATRTKQITSIASLNSCDIVTRPSAGGAFRRILHSDTAHEDLVDTTQKGNDTMSDNAAESTETIVEIQTNAGHDVHLEQQIVEQQRLQVEQMLQETRQQCSELLLERHLHESILPVAVKQQVRERFAGRIFEESELEAELQRSVNMMAQLTQDGLIRGNGYEKSSVSGMITEAEKIQAAFDSMFDLEIDTTRLGNIRPFEGIREAYARVTGDAAVTGGLSGLSSLGQIRVSEHAPIGRITEADTTTASFSYLLGTSMNKRLLKDYQAWPAEWMKFCQIVPIRDFKQQSRVRFGAFGSLPVVPEDSAYTTATLTDSAATYVPQKRGNLVTVSREVIINDDLQAIKQIPTKLAVAAAYTLAEFVYGFLTSGANIYDGSPLFTSGAPHNNLGASALSTAAMQTGVTAMREQTNYAGKRIGLRPRYLVVPPELEWTAMVATKSAGVPGGSLNDVNPMLGFVAPIVSPQLTSSTQWFLIADPREVDTIEVGFVGGEILPTLLVQDNPLVGLNYTNDVISYKCRHSYGGAVNDWRGFYRGV